MTRAVLTTVIALVLSGCNGGSPQGPVTPGPTLSPAEALITGDGSDVCLQEGDLPEGYLPLAGRENTENAITYAFAAPGAEEAARMLTASWSALPEGGAGPEDRTAECTVYLFDTREIDGIYAWYTETFPTRADPSPVEVEAPAGGPGEEPHLYHDEPNPYSGREGYTYVFRYANAIVRVGTDARSGDVSPEDVVPLAETVHERMRSRA